MIDFSNKYEATTSSQLAWHKDLSYGERASLALSKVRISNLTFNACELNKQDMSCYLVSFKDAGRRILLSL